MRAAAILGLGCTEKDLRPFQSNSDATWLLGLPGTSAEADAILIFGGDGTVHRHLAQLVKLQLPVLVVPCGSGNDFARALGLRSVRDSLAAWRDFSSGRGKVRAIDLGLIAPLQSQIADLARSKAEVSGVAADPSGSPLSQGQRPCSTQNLTAEAPAPYGHYFCCVAGVGLDADVARRANQLPRWLRGHGGYAVSLPASLFHFAPSAMKISGADGHGALVTRSDKPTVLAAFANTPAYGSGMKIAPRARMDDGLLDLCIVSNIDKFKLFCLFPTVYFGRHLSRPEVDYSQVTCARIETEKPLDVYADGEFVCQTPVEVSVARGALRVISR